MLTFTSGHFEIRKWPKNYQNLLRTFIETFTPNCIQIRLVVLKKKIPENGKIRIVMFLDKSETK